jgi:hypothetical protein
MSRSAIASPISVDRATFARSLAKWVTARAAHRGRLVALAGAVTAEAGRAVASRGGFVRRVAGRAGRVIRDAVEPGQRRFCVAALAGRRACAAAGTVRAMAGRAIERAAVRRLGLGGVAAGAARWLLPRSVRDVTARAGLMATRRRARFGAVAGCTRARRRARRVARMGVAAGAGRMAGATRGRRAIGVAARAEGGARDGLRPVGRVATAARCVAGSGRRLRTIGVAASTRRSRRSWLATVRNVAVEARRRRVRGRRMTARACHGLGGRAERAGVWRMASDARFARSEHGPRTEAPGRPRMVHLLGVAARASARRVVVWRMACRALRMRLGSEHRPAGVARGARLDLGCLEAMGCVAAGARGVAGGSRGVGDAERRLLRGVTARASLIGCRARLVDAVAVDAPARTGVLGLLLRVAFRARLGVERRRLVGAMAARARLIGVQPDGVRRPLRLVVTSHASGGLSAFFPERVAVLARRLPRSVVKRRGDRGVAAFTQRGSWRREPAFAVAVCARHLAEV